MQLNTVTFLGQNSPTYNDLQNKIVEASNEANINIQNQYTNERISTLERNFWLMAEFVCKEVDGLKATIELLEKSFKAFERSIDEFRKHGFLQGRIDKEFPSDLGIIGKGTITGANVL